MVIVNIVGGLGNQMFQYACGYGYAHARSVELQLDLSAFFNRKYINPEGFLLKRLFGIDRKAASLSSYFRVLGAAAPLLKLKYRLDVSRFSRNFISERRLFTLAPSISAPSLDNAYLFGWWQVSDYVDRHADHLRGVFKFDDADLPAAASNILAQIRSENAVAVHVRRGDYASNKQLKEIYGVCSEEYYSRSMQYIRALEPRASFFVFSNDVGWVRQSSTFKDCVVVDCAPPQSSWIDMHLMSRCRHAVIANSTFSWWGAWLMSNREKIVIAPRTWFADGTPTPDLLPSNWIRL